MGSVVGSAASVPNDRARTRVEVCRYFLAHTEVRAKNSKPGNGGIPASDYCTKESDCICVDLESLNLEKDLDEAMKDGENEVDDRDLGESNTIPKEL